MKKELLKFNQNITFKVGDKVLKYESTGSYLRRKGGENSDIFVELNIDNKNKFCEQIYGYSVHRGLTKYGFPECNSGDYAALTRVYNALQELCDEHNGVTKEITYEIY